MCNYTQDLINSIDQFSLSGELNATLDKYLTFDEDSIFDSPITERIKSTIVDEADSLVNMTKDSIKTKIQEFNCAGRRLETMEIGQDGYPRLLMTEDNTFDVLATAILGFPGVKSAFAGYFPDRAELGMDVVIRLERAFGPDDFKDAMDAVFDLLAPAQAIFGEDGGIPQVETLLNNAELLVNFELSISSGLKIDGALTDFFNFGSSMSDAALGSLFVRIEELDVSATASAPDLSIDVFPGLLVTNGSLSLEVGVRLPYPLEFSLSATGDYQGFGLSATLSNQTSFEPFGSLEATFPISVTSNGITQDFEIIATDGDFFDDIGILVKVNYNACAIADVLQTLLAKLGSLSVVPQKILGPSSFGGIGANFFNVSDAIGTLNDIFPDVSTVRVLLHVTYSIMKNIFSWNLPMNSS